MKAGKMAHVIEVQRATRTINDAGTPSTAWTRLATLRAEVVERSTEEFIRDGGAADEERIVFRTRFLEGITSDDRVTFDGQSYNIRELTRIGRRQGLELRCTALNGEG